MLGMGAATRFSVRRGAGDHRGQDLLFTGAVRMAAVAAAAFVLLGQAGSGILAELAGGQGDVREMTAVYLKVLLTFAPFFIMNDVLICFVRNDGGPRLAMAGMLAGSGLNIVLDYVFIFPMGMGIFGAALATGLSPVWSILILSSHIIRKKNTFRLTRGRMDKGMPSAILSLGFSSLVAEVSSGVVIIVFNALIMGLKGDVGVAAYGVIANISLVVAAVYTGLAQGMQPLMSQAYGLGDGAGLKAVLRYGFASAAFFSSALYAGIYVFAPEITAVFNSEENEALAAMAVPGLRIYFLSAVFMGANIIFAMYFASREKALPAQAIALTRGLFLVIPMAVLMARIWGITGVWMSFPATEAAVCLGTALMRLRVRGVRSGVFR